MKRKTTAAQKLFKQPAKPVDKDGNSIPVAVMAGPTGDTFEIHAYRSGQECQIMPQATMRFGGPDSSAGIVYVQRGRQGVSASDAHVDDECIWSWVQEWMQAGFNTDKLTQEIVRLRSALSRIAHRGVTHGYQNEFEMCQLIAKETLEANQPKPMVAAMPQLRLNWDGEKRPEWHNLEAIVNRPSATTREIVAELVRCLGYTAYIGGRHVAVHNGPGPTDRRIGYFTSTTLPDFQ